MIQIDMPMPTNCIDCPFSLDNCCLVLGKYISLKHWAKGGRQKWCPLKEQEAIVRCKDCIAAHDGELIYEMWCGITGKRIMRDDFCSNGRRKDE